MTDIPAISAQPALPGMVSASDHAAELRAREDDPTPRGVVRAVLTEAVGDFAPVWNTEASEHLDDLGFMHPGEEPPRTTRVLDVDAGFGCWSSEMRRLAAAQGWPVHVTGVEMDQRKAEHLGKWCDDVVIGDDVSTLEAAHRDGVEWDIAIGNPRFTVLTHEDPAKSLPGLLLRLAPAVLLLHTQQAFLKSEAGRACWRAHPPAASWLVPGGVKFRGASQGADARCYQVTLWLRGHAGPCAVHLLDDLSPAERSWSRLPGTEDATEAAALGLPMVPQ